MWWVSGLGFAKRARLKFLGVRLDEGVSTRVRCRNDTKWDVPKTLLTWDSCSLEDFPLSTMVHSGLEFWFGLQRERCSLRAALQRRPRVQAVEDPINL